MNQVVYEQFELVLGEKKRKKEKEEEEACLCIFI